MSEDTTVLATGNAGKIKEFSALLSSKKCIPQRELGIEDAPETGETFIENALLKARHASTVSNMPSLADDSGLVIPALGGKPGIYSARFAGLNASSQDNMDLVLRELREALLDGEKVDAYFYCVIVILQHAKDPTPVFGIGRLKGRIVFEPKGTNGFGYDPIFYLPEYECTLAELSADEKNKISHRARAVKALKSQSFPL